MKSEYEHFEREYSNNFDVTINSIKENTIIDIYVDGSFNDKKQKYSYAFSVVKNDLVIYTETGFSNNTDISKFGSVGAELYSAIKAFEFVNKYKIKSIRINFDYIGIRDFALERNKKIALASQYYDNYQANLKNTNVIFNKLKAHGDNKYHNSIDKLSKKSLSQENHK